MKNQKKQKTSILPYAARVSLGDFIGENANGAKDNIRTYCRTYLGFKVHISKDNVITCENPDNANSEIMEYLQQIFSKIKFVEDYFDKRSLISKEIKKLSVPTVEQSDQAKMLEDRKAIINSQYNKLCAMIAEAYKKGNIGADDATAQKVTASKRRDAMVSDINKELKSLKADKTAKEKKEKKKAKLTIAYLIKDLFCPDFFAWDCEEEEEDEDLNEFVNEEEKEKSFSPEIEEFFNFLVDEGVKIHDLLSAKREVENLLKEKRVKMEDIEELVVTAMISGDIDDVDIYGLNNYGDFDEYLSEEDGWIIR